MISTIKEIMEKQDLFDIHGDPYIETPWHLIEAYFKGHHLERLVRHQLESYDNFIGFQIAKTIEMFNPVHIASENDFDPVNNKYSLEIFVTFDNFQIYRPQIHENNGAVKLMFPQEARLRNFTYSSAMTVDINIKYMVRTGSTLDTLQIFHKTLPKIHIGKMPIMLKSSICVLNQYKHFENTQTGECKYDAGGYFIINGSEKTVLGQERAAENKVYCFYVGKNNTKYSWSAEIKSVPDFKCISPKQINMMISSKNNGFGFPIFLQLPRVKQPISLFVVFRALGILSDKDICEKILLKLDDANSKMLEALQASIIDANKYISQEECIKHITSYAMYSPINTDKETGAKKKMEFTMDILNNDLFPHCHNMTQKIYFLGYMTNKILQASFDMIKQDDRDSYANKRIDLTGSLLNNLFRNYFNKLVKDMEKQVVREINTGSWKSKDDYENIINFTNICKIIKSTTIENGIKRALSTGDFGIKHTNSNKVGVAQVLNRLTYVSALSHARRISTPTDKSGKLIPPRKLHNTSWGYLCPAETPEGQSVGIVKNLSYMTHITIYSNSAPLYEYIMPEVISLNTEGLIPADFYEKVKVFINGSWVGITENPEGLFLGLKEKKYKGIINIYTSILFDYRFKEIRVCNDSGRLTRPLLRVKDGNMFLNATTLSRLIKSEIQWNDLLTSSSLADSVIEYIDPEEQSWSMIATKPRDLLQTSGETMYKFTHCEIHPSTIFGILASCIPFPEHNQSPRNCYQCAQSKQAMGVYVTNYENRMDKTAYVMTYPSRPLVDTRTMNLIQLNKIPSGANVIVAIMTHTGYNQEDSLLFNKGSIDRGLFVTTIYHTEKDEDKQKMNGDEEIRCKPDPTKTKGMKFGNYNKVNSKGVIPENTLVENRDIIISKVVPIKENKNDHTKVIKYEDQSKIHRTTEETYVDKNYIDRNGEGYNFAKIRLRTFRKPVIGDKFCALPTQQVLTNHGWIEIKDIDITLHKVCTLDATGNMTYEYPTARFEYDHNDKMYFLENKQVHVICTLNHKLYVKKRSGKNYELIQAKDVMGKMVRFQKTMTNANPEVEFMEFGEEFKYKMDDWLQLLGMFIADGHTDSYNSGVFLTALKDRKKEFNTNTLENLCLEYSYHKNGNYFISGNKYSHLYNHFSKLSVGALHKYLPEYVWNLSERQSKILLHALLQGDGSSMKYKDETFDRYGTISLRLANDITRLALHCGYSGIVKIAEEPTGIARVGKRNLGSRAGETVVITQKHTYYKVSIITKQNQPWINKKDNDSNVEKLIDYEGKVYCIEMASSHTYYMRESNHSPCLIVGNSSRHGQKGTIGNIIPECDMPFTSSGVKPDIIINPHAIPSRMTIGQLKETVLGKVLVELGLFGDGTSFGQFDVKDICGELMKCGYEAHGNELLHNGTTGEQVECSVFMGPVFYQRLKHMVNDKSHSRSIGPMVNLTRQPAEGRSRDGGLRFGEMERDCSWYHSPIPLNCGLSVEIGTMENKGYSIISYDEGKKQLIPSTQSDFLCKGERECVDVVFQDGRKIRFTENHKMLTSDNTWIPIREMIKNVTQIKTGITSPLIYIKEEIKKCANWNFQAGNTRLEVSTEESYFHALSFARLIGYICADGGIYYDSQRKAYKGVINLGHKIDVASVLEDLQKFATITQKVFMCKNYYSVTIPPTFVADLLTVEGILIGSKVQQPAKLPAFVLDESCPLPIVREFLGGLFGGDGHTCYLGLHRGKRDLLTSVSFSKSKTGKHLDSLQEMLKNLQRLFTRFDIHKVTIQNARETTSSKKKGHALQKNKSYQVLLHLSIDELVPFHEKIGFRYCCHKSQRLEAGVSYKRLKNEVVRQHNWLVQRVDELTSFSKIKSEFPDKIVHTKKAIQQAIQELEKTEAILHEYAVPSTHDITDHLIKGTVFGKFTGKGFPSAEEYLKEIGALDWFLQDEPVYKNMDDADELDNSVFEDQDQGDQDQGDQDQGDQDQGDQEQEDQDQDNLSLSCYGVNRECEGLPTMNLKVIDIRPAGVHPVYDIQVDETHTFLANGIVAHNCMISHGASRFTRGRMYDASDKYSVHVCKKCGLIASYNDKMGIHHCRTCDNRVDFAYLEIPYSCKLLFQELNTMNIAPRFITEK